MANHAYIRVSGMDQGLSLEAQQERIAKYAKYKGLEIDHWHIDENISGGKLISNRRAGRQMTNILQKGDTIFVTQIDRLFRNLGDGYKMEQEWHKMDISILVVDNGGQAVDTNQADGWFSFMINLLLSERERRVVGERTRKVKRSIRLRGEHVSGLVPYGYTKVKGKDSRKLVKCPEEQATIEVIIDLRKDGRTYQEISDFLRTTGSKPRKAKKWTPSIVSNLIKRLIKDEKRRSQDEEEIRAIEGT